MTKRFLTVLFTAIILLMVGYGLFYAAESGDPDSSSTEVVSDDESSDNSTPDNDLSESDAVSDTSTKGDHSFGEETSYEQTDINDTRFSFLACPDNIIHPSVYYDAIKKAATKAGKTPVYTSLADADYDFLDIYEYVKDDIKSADLSYINVETLIGGNVNGIAGYPQFNTPEQAGQTLIDMGFDIYNLAHNHMLDSNSDKFLINCDKFFRDRGKLTLGYYKDQEDVENIKYVDKNGVRIAFLAYTYSTNGIPLNSGSSTVIPYINTALITRQMEIAKENSDLVFVSMHWGDEDRYAVNAQQKSTAQLLVDLGADVIIGMHAHVIQEMKWVERGDGGRCLLTYGLGNFISGMQDGMNMLGGMLSFDIAVKNNKITIEKPIFHPIVTHYTFEGKVYKDDTGYRNFKIYPLNMYNDELAAAHDVQNWDKTHTPSLVGGKLNIANLRATVKKYIPAEFLPDYMK